MMKTFIFAIIPLFLLGCGERVGTVTPNTLSRDAYLQTLDSAEWHNSLITWTSDTAFTTDRELMLLLDTLYQHVRSEGFPSEVKKEEAWMSNYRFKLYSYYQSHYQGNNTIPIYAKADSVLSRGEWLLELGNHWSTMEMVVYNSATYTFDKFREYNILTQVISNCENDEAKNIVYKEWSMYDKMFEKIGPIASNFICLNYWGGSITGPLGTGAYRQLSQIRRDMYQTILNIIKGEGWDATGVYLSNAEHFFFDCSTTTLKRIVDESDEFYKEYEGKEPENGFYETINETKVAIDELRPLVKEWISHMDEVDRELTHDGSRHSIERAASYMLMKWASIVTER